MVRLTLEQIRDLQVDILNELDDFCKANHITYFLCNGTLLGAVKYKGYIPWDDDIDVCLLREDYERLIRLYPADGSRRFHLFSSHSDKNYFFPFAKLSDPNTLLIEANTNNGVSLGVNIDIFPIDNYGDTADELQKRFMKFKRLRRQLNGSKLCNFHARNIVRSIGKWALTLPYRIIGPQFFCSKMTSEAVKMEKTEYVGNCVWGFYGVGEAHKQAVFSDAISVEFEGKQYPAPVGYHEYLVGLYGDYRQDPPLDKQCTHHSYEAYLKDI